MSRHVVGYRIKHKFNSSIVYKSNYYLTEADVF